jgi:hypothetical protein
VGFSFPIVSCKLNTQVGNEMTICEDYRDWEERPKRVLVQGSGRSAATRKAQFEYCFPLFNRLPNSFDMNRLKLQCAHFSRTHSQAFAEFQAEPRHAGK